MGNQLMVHASEGDCPVQMSECPSTAAGAAPLDPTNMMPPANQLPAPNQPFPLPTERQKSSIPRAGTKVK